MARTLEPNPEHPLLTTFYRYVQSIEQTPTAVEPVVEQVVVSEKAAVDVPAVVEAVAEEPVSTERQYSFEELATLSTKKDLHLLISGRVYNIAKFLDEHPGGDEVLFGETGRDATEAFEDVGHSDEARTLLEKYYVGVGPEGAAKAIVKKVRAVGDESSSGNFTYLLPLALLVAYLAYRFYAPSPAIVV